MRILVVSDSHRNIFKLFMAIEEQPEAKHIIFLGDGEDDIEQAEKRYPERIFHKVKGNCDLYSDLPLEKAVTLEGYKILFTHGHSYMVKYGNTSMISAAHSAKADICLYGHTHVPYTSYDDGLYIMNPGSIGQGSYGIIDLTPSGAMCNTLEVTTR